MLSRSYEIARSALEISLPTRWLHVLGVAKRAELAASVIGGAEAELLVSAALLHDIGYSPDICCTGFHALDGAVYLRGIGFDDRLCGLVAHHSCAYREAELRELSAELAQWTDEMTSLRDALWWADMTTTPKGEPTNVHDRIEEIQKRYGAEHLVTFFIRQAKVELVGAVERTEARLHAAGLDYAAK